MQLFSMDNTIFLKLYLISSMKIWKNRLSTANQSAKTSPNLNFCSMKLLTAWLVHNDFEYFKVRSSNQRPDHYTYQVSVYLPSISILIVILFWFSNTDTSYFKNILKYWYFSIVFLISISIFLFIFIDFVTINMPISASSGL